MGTGENYRCGHTAECIWLLCFRYRRSPRQKHGVCLSRNQPYMCRDFVKEYGVNSFWELPKEVISDREHRFLHDVTPMIVADLIAVSSQYETVICEGDIDYGAIIPVAEHFVYLNNRGTKFDWFDRPGHENIVETVNRRTNLTDEEKAEIIRKAYDAVSGDEGVVPPLDIGKRR